ncbi:IclR family transcriptional regulator [Mesobacillus zeae]|uniref:Glycerol operon regulatory protein n=1 Tax=Mesobacillus zeae TaxID=1917180 RepID=A0A398BLY8_9BACI|nr:IclR family transcriptional regulator [Mesobacillus zeae]RID88780.1 IclR family transcriptional regulator [Mesobacillus zeae]
MERVNTVKSVGRALEIIEIVSAKKNGLGVTEIAKQIDINKSSVHRILATLVQYGYVVQDGETGKYRLGYKFLEYSSRLLDSIDLRAEARPFLQELEKETNEVIHLVIHDHGEVVYIEKLEGNETLRMHSKVGRRAPMHCTSVGKAILAFLPENIVFEILARKGLPQHTEKTITKEDVLLQELEEIGRKGYALDLEENEKGITCIAVPILDHSGRAVAAVSVSGPSTRMSDGTMQELQGEMKQIGRELSARLGYSARMRG